MKNTKLREKKALRVARRQGPGFRKEKHAGSEQPGRKPKNTRMNPPSIHRRARPTNKTNTLSRSHTHTHSTPAPASRKEQGDPSFNLLFSYGPQSGSVKAEDSGGKNTMSYEKGERAKKKKTMATTGRKEQEAEPITENHQ